MLKFSIIIPVLRERDRISRMLEILYAQPGIEKAEVIVVDGNPNGSTLAAVDDDRVVRLIGPAGRGPQMNAGSRRADGEILIFLHADTQLPIQALQLIEQAMQNPAIKAGAFDLGIDSPKWIYRVIEMVSSWRSRLMRIPFGDQVIFIRREYFEQLGRFAEIPILEDLELMKRIRKRKDKIVILPERVRTSARRWEKEGIGYTLFRNWRIRWLYKMGISPERLAR